MMSNEEFEKIKSLILERQKEGLVFIRTIEDIRAYNVQDFVQQDADGILYDLNRGQEVTLTLASPDDERWINDLAVAVVIKELKRQLDEYKEKYENR
jgi:hypothetical protein